MSSPGRTIDVQQITLTVATWAKLVALVGTSVAAFFGMFLQSQQTMHSMDLKWQDRIAALTAEIRSDIARVERRIPPELFLEMVRENRKLIDQFESEFSRDFVRKEELRTILNQRGK